MIAPRTAYSVFANLPDGTALHVTELLAAVPAGLRSRDEGERWVHVLTRAAALRTRVNLTRIHPAAHVRIFAEPPGRLLADDEFTLDADGIFVPVARP